MASLQISTRTAWVMLFMGLIPVIPTVWLTALYGWDMPLPLGLFIILLAWYFVSFNIVDQNENGIAIIAGSPLYQTDSGLTWVPAFIGRVYRFPKQLVELELPTPAGIVTKAGVPNGETDKVERTTVSTTVSFRFFYPDTTSALIRAAATLPDPRNLPALITLFEEEVLNLVRTAGGELTWVDLATKRHEFSADVNRRMQDIITNNANHLLTTSGIRNPSIAIKHLEFPPELKDALSKPEIARLLKIATITNAEGEKAATKLRGEGVADARRSLYDAIGTDTLKEALFTLREMAQGPATTIFPIPTNLLDALSGILNSPRPNANQGIPIAEIIGAVQGLRMPDAQKQLLMTQILRLLQPQQGRGNNP